LNLSWNRTPLPLPLPLPLLSKTPLHKEKAQAVLLNRELKPAVKVPKLLKTPVILPARSQSGPINMTGRQQIATLNGPNSEIPR
jgi:hypothetical protein